MIALIAERVRALRTLLSFLKGAFYQATANSYLDTRLTRTYLRFLCPEGDSNSHGLAATTPSK